MKSIFLLTFSILIFTMGCDANSSVPPTLVSVTTPSISIITASPATKTASIPPRTSVIPSPEIGSTLPPTSLSSTTPTPSIDQSTHIPSKSAIIGKWRLISAGQFFSILQPGTIFEFFAAGAATFGQFGGTYIWVDDTHIMLQGSGPSSIQEIHSNKDTLTLIDTTGSQTLLQRISVESTLSSVTPVVSSAIIGKWKLVSAGQFFSILQPGTICEFFGSGALTFGQISGTYKWVDNTHIMIQGSGPSTVQEAQLKDGRLLLIDPNGSQTVLERLGATATPLTPTATLLTPSATVPECSWQLLGFSGVGIYSIVFSPAFSVDRTVLIGGTSGTFRSADAGASWSNVVPASIALQSHVFSPDFATDATMFASSTTGAYRSTDRGVTWNRWGAPLNSMAFISISPNYSKDLTLFAGTYGLADGAHVYRSTDQGLTWNQTLLVAGYDVRGITISPNFASDGTVFLGVGKSNNLDGGVYRSTDRGASWSAVNTGLDYREVGALVISPNYTTDHTLFVTTWTGGIYRSTNGGNSWTVYNNNQPNRRLSALAVSPNFAQDSIIFLGTWGEIADGGVYSSTSGGARWKYTAAGLTTKWIHRLVMSPTFSEDGVVLAGGEQTHGGGLWKCSYTISPSSAASISLKTALVSRKKDR